MNDASKAVVDRVQAAPNIPAASGQEWKAVTFKAFGSDNMVELSIAMVRKFIAAPSKSGKLPEDRDCINFLMMCKAKQLNPWEGDAFLVGYDGQDGTKWTQITAHQAFLKRAETQDRFDGMESGVIVRTKEGRLSFLVGDFFDSDAGEVLLGGWARINFKDRKFPMEKRVKLTSFRKPTKIWNENPAGMIVKCAEADALRSAFPTVLGGLFVREELDVTPDGEGGKPRQLFPAPDRTPPPVNTPPPAPRAAPRAAEEVVPTPTPPPADEAPAASQAPDVSGHGQAVLVDPPPGGAPGLFDELARDTAATIAALNALSPEAFKRGCAKAGIKLEDGEALEHQPLHDLKVALSVGRGAAGAGKGKKATE